MGRNNGLQLFPRLTEEPHVLPIKTPGGCEIGGLKSGDGGVAYDV
jgi:hypothetical protein